MKITIGEVEYEMSTGEFMELVNTRGSIKTTFRGFEHCSVTEVHEMLYGIGYSGSYITDRIFTTKLGKQYRLQVVKREHELKDTFDTCVKHSESCNIDNFNDWSIPSINELRYLHKNYRQDFNNCSYWSHETAGPDHAYKYDFINGVKLRGLSRTLCKSRLVRRIYV